MELSVDYATFAAWVTAVIGNLTYVVDEDGNYNLFAQIPGSALLVNCILSPGDPNIDTFITNLQPQANQYPIAYKTSPPNTAAFGSLVSDPLTSTVLVSSSTVPQAGNYLLSVSIASTIAAVFELQFLSGATVLSSIYIMVQAHDTKVYEPALPFNIAAGTNFQVITSGTVLGSVQANILYALA